MKGDVLKEGVVKGGVVKGWDDNMHLIQALPFDLDSFSFYPALFFPSKFSAQLVNYSIISSS